MQFQLAATGTARYRANGAAHSYVVTKAAEVTGWVLDIYSQDRSITDLVLLGDRKEYVYTDRLRDARAIAAEFEALGEDYRSCDHGYANRLTVAIDRAYAKA